MKTKISIWRSIIIVALILALFHQCTQTEPKTTTVTKIEYVTDTITEVKIDTVPEVVYVNRYKTITGKDSIVYRNVPDTTTIKANRFKTSFVSGKSKSDLEITTTGQLLDVTGTTTYPEVTTTITNNIDNSGKFIYLKADVINPTQNVELGVLMHYKNKFGVIGSLGYDNRLQGVNNNFSVMVGAAIRF